MPWICPRECHKSAPGWCVIQCKIVEENYYMYAAGDKSLSDGELRAGASVGTVQGGPLCSACGTCVTWEEPPAVKANTYQVTWEGTKGEIFTTDPFSVCFTGGDAIAEHVMVLATFHAQFRNPSEVARIVKVEIYEKEST